MNKIQYISQGKDPLDHLHHIEEVCKAGGKWIQLRLKDVDMATYLKTALKCRQICDRYEAIMIINDNVGIAKASQADGVHLGLDDMSIVEARRILGDNYIIGRTANTINDCLQHIEDKADYIGLGPFRHTTTKKNLSPILGIEGYKQITTELAFKNSNVPVVAIGGIKLEDIGDILNTGIDGVAVSGMLTNSTELEEIIKKINSLIAFKAGS
ncbi:thiamine phosphate synthase [Aquimarina sp. 2201CG1-2-11]|uniref:thiamine phosphate synthase n=1 Tax=Aquimarina discodermiae TaxID=3231043 RepID=UPI00346285EB